MLLYVRQSTTAMTALVITIRHRNINFCGTTIQCSESKRVIVTTMLYDLTVNRYS